MGDETLKNMNKYNRLTTAKTRLFSGANITSAESNPKKMGKSEVENELTSGIYPRHKSFTSRKLKFYSENDESEKASNGTVEIRPAASHENKNQKFQPNVIKGFCTPEPSSEPEIAEPIIHENKTELKYDFYNSGIGFHDESRGKIPNDKSRNNEELIKKSHRNTEHICKLSFNDVEPSSNKSLGIM
jgi:hypothetical protein